MTYHYYGLANTRKEIGKMSFTMQRTKQGILKQLSKGFLLWQHLCCDRSNR